MQLRATPAERECKEKMNRKRKIELGLYKVERIHRFLS
jgi:hypothetical protein